MPSMTGSPKALTSEATKLRDGEESLAQGWSASWLGAFIGLMLVCRIEGAEAPVVLPLWPGAVPGDYGTIGPERVRAPAEAPTKDAKWITNVTKPAVTVFRAAQAKNTRTAILV